MQSPSNQNQPVVSLSLLLVRQNVSGQAVNSKRTNIVGYISLFSSSLIQHTEDPGERGIGVGYVGGRPFPPHSHSRGRKQSKGQSS